jgi:chemotaxis protein MotA
MDMATILGIILALAAIIGSIFLAPGGASNFKFFLNHEAFLIVLGGTFCAIMVNYPWAQVWGLRKVLKKVMLGGGEDTSHIVVTFVEITKKARQSGILSIESDVKNIKDDFMRRGLQLVIDGQDKEFIANMLETEIGFIRERHKVGAEIFASLGTYSPALGIIGTVMGMMLMLGTIDDVAAVPKKMASALAAAFFGLGLGYLVFLPMSGKLKRRSEEELLIKEIIIRGVLLLQTQRH